MIPHSELVVVRAFSTGPEAEMAKCALESAGIDSIIEADTIGGMRPHIAWSGSGFKIVVRQEDAGTACKILSEQLMEQPLTADSAEAPCPDPQI